MTPYTEKEEYFNVLSHLLGFILALVGFYYLVFIVSETYLEKLSYGLYGASGIVLYLSSSLYHLAKEAKLKKLLKICDHSAIYVFIAGCYTPFILLHLQSEGSRNLLIGVWVLALLGSLLKLFFAGQFRVLSTVIYLAMGWLVTILGEELSYSLSNEAIIWLVGGGLSYSFGTLFYLFRKIPYHHGIWHLFVLLGSALHFVALLISS